LTFRIVGYNINYVINLNQKIMKKVAVITYKHFSLEDANDKIAKINWKLLTRFQTISQKMQLTDDSIRVTWYFSEVDNSDFEYINETINFDVVNIKSN